MPATDRRSGRFPTIRDVAARAGVATSTVSRALSDPGRVHPATRARVLQAVEQVRYVPSAQARSLSTGRTGSVALLIPDVTNPFYFGIIRGTQTQLRASGYHQLLVDTEESPRLEADALASLATSVDGVVLTATRLSDAEVVRVGRTMPLVTINRVVAGVPAVVLDTAPGVEQVLQHLASFGHRSIGYIAGPAQSWSNTRRWASVRGSAKRLGISAVNVGAFAPRITSGAAAADAALNAGVTACFAFNDLLAIGMLDRFAQRGVSVPGEMSVVGCDDIFGSDFCHPALTTVSGSQELVGRAAVTMLIANLARPAPEPAAPVRLPTHLTIRASTGPAPPRGRPDERASIAGAAAPRSGTSGR